MKNNNHKWYGMQTRERLVLQLYAVGQSTSLNEYSIGCLLALESKPFRYIFLTEATANLYDSSHILRTIIRIPFTVCVASGGLLLFHHRFVHNHMINPLYHHNSI